jgi:hypothetical protein
VGEGEPAVAGGHQHPALLQLGDGGGAVAVADHAAEVGAIDVARQDCCGVHRASRADGELRDAGGQRVGDRRGHHARRLERSCRARADRSGAQQVERQLTNEHRRAAALPHQPFHGRAESRRVGFELREPFAGLAGGPRPGRDHESRERAWLVA